VRIDFADLESGWTALHRACYSGHFSIARKLIERGASLSVVDHDGLTPADLIRWSFDSENRDKLVLGPLVEWFQRNSQHSSSTPSITSRSDDDEFDAIDDDQACAANQTVSALTRAHNLLYAFGDGANHQLGFVPTGDKAVQRQPRLISGGSVTSASGTSCALPDVSVDQLALHPHGALAIDQQNLLIAWGSVHQSVMSSDALPRITDRKRLTQPADVDHWRGKSVSHVATTSSINHHYAVVIAKNHGVFAWGSFATSAATNKELDVKTAAIESSLTDPNTGAPRSIKFPTDSSTQRHNRTQICALATAPSRFFALTYALFDFFFFFSVTANAVN
jgi:hypothetical protein